MMLMYGSQASLDGLRVSSQKIRIHKRLAEMKNYNFVLWLIAGELLWIVILLARIANQVTY